MIGRLFLAGTLVVGLAACSSDDDGAGSAATAPTSAPATAPDAGAAPTTDIPAAAPTAATATPTTAAAPATPATADPVWTNVVPGGDCECAQGGPFSYWVRKADPTKVVLYFQGGGACFSADTCNPASGAYKATTGPEDDPTLRRSGIFDMADPRNPFADWSMVYVPYCTGDVFLGDKTTTYSDTVTVDHVGAVNAKAAIQGLAQTFPDANEVFVTGESAGGVPTPLAAGQMHDLLPDAKLVALADSSGAYPDVPAINSLVGGLWGTLDALPPWPQFNGITQEQLSIPGLFVAAGKHDPSITFARHDYAADQTQAFFGSLAGFDASNLVTLIDKNEQEIEAAGVQVASYVAPGTSHTVLGQPGFYTETVNGVRLRDWVADLANGTPVTDVHCQDCQPAG